MADKESAEPKAHTKGSDGSAVNPEVTLDLSDDSSNMSSEQPDEETLEDLAEDSAVRESQNFSESQFERAGSEKMPSSTLPSNPQSQEAVQSSEPFKSEPSLERSASSSIGDSGGRSQQEKPFEERQERPQRQYRADYQENMPAYEGSISEEVASNRRNIEERGGAARNFEDLRQTQRSVSAGNPEFEEARRRGNNQEDIIKEYTVTELSRPDDSPKDPLARKREYRTLRR